MNDLITIIIIISIIVSILRRLFFPEVPPSPPRREAKPQRPPIIPQETKSQTTTQTAQQQVPVTEKKDIKTIFKEVMKELGEMPEIGPPPVAEIPLPPKPKVKKEIKKVDREKEIEKLEKQILSETDYWQKEVPALSTKDKTSRDVYDMSIIKSHLHLNLNDSEAVRNGIIISAILAPPKALRSKKRRIV
jgi:hypothetical protein